MYNALMSNKFLIVVVGFTVLFVAPVLAAAEFVVNLDITGSRGIANCATVPVNSLNQSYLLVEAPEPAQASGVLVLFVGGGGKLDIADSQLRVAANNFLLRSRYLFAAQGYHVAIMDAASDFLVCKGGLRNRRTSGKFSKDMQAVVDDLRMRYPDLPVSLIGTSRGTIAAAQGAATIVPGVDAVVLTSSMANPITATVFDAPLTYISQPVLITFHEQDACFVTPPAGTAAIKQALTSSSKVTIKGFSDGFPALSNNPCDATTPHGYLGMEAKIVGKIVQWLKQN